MELIRDLKVVTRVSLSWPQLVPARALRMLSCLLYTSDAADE